MRCLFVVCIIAVSFGAHCQNFHEIQNSQGNRCMQWQFCLSWTEAVKIAGNRHELDTPAWTRHYKVLMMTK